MCEESSVVIVKKNTNGECLKRKLKRLATVPNCVKLEKKDENAVECPICLSDLRNIKDSRIGKLACGHMFCYGCIR